VTPLARRALDDAMPPRIPESGRPVVTRFTAHGREHLAAFAALPDSQEWVVGVMVPEDAYTKNLEHSRTRLLTAASAVGLLMLGGGVIAARAARRRFGAIVRETERMGAFDFAATPRPAATLAVREIESVLDGMERAKAALRALSKFVPVDLVRRLHADGGGDPRPGGELREVTVLFSDIEGFTGLSECIAPDVLAEIMSLYFDRITHEVHTTRGIVDKFIGDAVMALWNAPEPAAGHAALACRAALACVAAERALQGEAVWSGHPRIRTRFGIHTGVVLVGNIGSRERLNFTALGDGVNLASRLEGLNKQYGTSILVSEAVVAAACAAGFPADAFRRIDRVAVKGRAGGVLVYELLETDVRGSAAVTRYETALARCFARDFAGAAALLDAAHDDPPSVVLRARITAFAAEPPPPGWDGTSVAQQK
jgi:adenylate cyclase